MQYFSCLGVIADVMLKKILFCCLLAVFATTGVVAQEDEGTLTAVATWNVKNASARNSYS